MPSRSGNEGDPSRWLERRIHVDLRTPQEAEAEGVDWNAALPPVRSPELTERLAKTNPYMTRIRELDGLIVPFDEAESYRGRWQSLFDKPQPLVVELGSGAGAFLRGEAQRRPDRNHIGFELRYKRIYLAALRGKEVAPNARYARYYAQHLTRVFEDQTLQGIYCQFPDPWPKARQIKNRVINPGTVRDFARLLVPGGFVRLKSDWPFYLDWFRGSFQDSPFQETAFVPNISHWDLPWENVKTTFETRFLKEGKPSFFIEFRLPEATPPSDNDTP